MWLHTFSNIMKDTILFKLEQQQQQQQKQELLYSFYQILKKDEKIKTKKVFSVLTEPPKKKAHI